MRMTTTDLLLQTQRLQMEPTAARRAALLFPVMETETLAITATQTPTETPRAPVEALQVRLAVVRPMVGRGPSPRGNALAQTPSRGSPVEPGLPSPTSNWWHLKTSSSPHATCQCVSGSTWPCHSPSLRPRLRSGSRTVGPSGRSRTLELTPLLRLVQEAQEDQAEEGAWGASAPSAHHLRSAGTWPCMLAMPATITPLQGAWSSCLSSPPAMSCLHLCWGHRVTLHPPFTAHTCRFSQGFRIQKPDRYTLKSLQSTET